MADPPGSREEARGAPERIPFYRNVKLLGWIAQIVFLVVAFAAIALLVRNVVTGLAASNLRFSFDFLDDRAGFALGEVPIAFSPSDPYIRAFWVGIVNTLRVAILGVVFCTLLGVLIGVMRLSSNWLLRQIATWYVELLRNTPLPVQLIFWYFAVILAVPPRILNSWRLGDVYVSQVGFAMPWIHTSPRFGAWLPGLIAAVLAFAALYVWRRRVIAQRERPGNAWAMPLLVALAVAAVGYLPPLLGAQPLAGAAAELQATQGRGTVFLDDDGDGTLDNAESPLARVPLTIGVASGQLTDTTQNLTESRQVKESAFRFPQLREAEAESIDVRFADPEAAEGLSIHFERFPSVGRVYRDLDGDGEFDDGETGVGEGAERETFNGVRLVLEVQGFERRVVSERGGRVFFPPFEPLVSGESEAEGSSAGAQTGGGMGALFAPTAEEAALEADVTFLPIAPLVYSAPSIPRSSYYGGISLSGAFLALLLGLVIYTASFVAEIVRGGIQAVPKGQTEAAKALGLSGSQVFGLVVFPQAMRIILPPMISQFLNLTKNSSLAILVTYEDFFNVSNIIGNQTGQFIPVYLVILIGYLGISIVFSFILNIVNARLALVER